MCGTVGLFAGCAATTFCPRSLLGERPVAPSPAAEQDERLGAGVVTVQGMDGWEERASVRVTPRRKIEQPSSHSRFFPESLVPVASHPLVRALPETQLDCLLTSHAYRYLDFTEQLETLVVNRVALGIARGTVGIPVSRATRVDAYRIYADEAYHALVSADLIMQLEHATGQAPRQQRAGFLHQLDQIFAQVEPSHRALVEILFVICSETLISGTLTVSSPGPDVEPTVVQAVRDHARDEGRHHVFFADYLRVLWAALSRDERRLAGRMVPSLVAAFLSPETTQVRTDLIQAGLDPGAAEQVVRETFAPERVRDYNLRSASRTLGYFADLGAFDDSCASERLGEQELELVGD